MTLFKHILGFQTRASATLTIELTEGATAALEYGLCTDCDGRTLLVLRRFAATIPLTHLDCAADTFDTAAVFLTE